MVEETGHLQSFRLGETDSEQFFLWMLARFARDGIELDAPDCPLLERSASTAVVEIDRRCREVQPEKDPRLTFVLTNGRIIVACRWNNPLHWLRREGVHDCEICGIPHIRHDDALKYRAIVFASEPITHEAWQEVPEESIFVVNEAFEYSLTSPPEGVQP
jgi:glutamine amidotransferase